MSHLFTELSPVEEKDKESKPDHVDHTPTCPESSSSPPAPVLPLQLLEPSHDKIRPRGINKPVHKSASASQLTLLIPPQEDYVPQVVHSPGGSSTSSRDGSPSREFSPLTGSLKPPIYIKRGPRGYGFTLRAIRVYYGNSDYYTLHHLVVVSTPYPH
jgi:microtubule-associated serine/threonine kinase